MKFRAKIDDVNLLKSITRLVNIFSKQSKDMVLRINKHNIFLISQDVQQGLHIWAELPVAVFFIEYLFEGPGDEENDQIYLSLCSDLFFRTLKLISTSTRSLKLKLAQHNSLSFIEVVIEQSSVDNKIIDVKYNIPIELISRKNWSNYEEPFIDNSENVFYLPPTKHIKQVIDKMKNFDKVIRFLIDSDGFIVRANNLNNSLATLYSQIKFKDNTVITNIHEFVEVDSKRLSIFFNSLNLNQTIKIETNIVTEKLIHFSFVQDNILFYFVLPHIIKEN